MLLICCPRDIRVTIGLGSRAADIGIASEDFERTICCCNGIALFASQILPLCFDNKVWTRSIAACSINVTIHTGLFCRSTLARKRDFARIAILQVIFIERMRVFLFRNTVSAIASLKVSCCCCRILRYVSQITIRLRLVISFDRDCRLYLEDVLVRIFCLSIRNETATALRAGMPVGCRLTVEILTKRVAVWRCRVDFPIAAFASRDGFLCRSQVLEGTIRAACVDDNGIVVRRLSNQCTIIMGAIQYDCAALTRRGQVDILMSRDTIDIDVTRSLDINALGVSRDAVADCDVLARDADAFVSVDNARVVATAANRDIASVDLDILQGNRVADVTGNVDFRIAGIDDEARMLQILFLDKATNRTSSLRDIVPFGLCTETNRDHRTRVVWLCFSRLSMLRITAVPFDVVVVNGRAIVVGKFRAFAVVGHAFWASDPVITIWMIRIGGFSCAATAAAADDQLILLWRAGQRVLKSRRDRSEIRIARMIRAFRRTLSHCLSSDPSLRQRCQIRGQLVLLRSVQLIIGQNFCCGFCMFINLRPCIPIFSTFNANQVPVRINYITWIPPRCLTCIPSSRIRRSCSGFRIPISATPILPDDVIIIRFDEVRPTFQTRRYALIGIAGVYRARDLDCTAGTSGLILCIKSQRTAVQADGHVTVEVDGAAIRRNVAVAHLTLVTEVRTDRAGLDRRAADRLERTAIRRDIGVDEDGTEAIAIRIRMEVDIQRTISRRDSRVDRDVALRFERQGRIFATRLIDGRIQRDGRDLIGIRCLYADTRTVIQQIRNRLAVDPRGLIAAGRAGCIVAAVITAICIAICDRTTATRFRIRDDDLERVE